MNILGVGMGELFLVLMIMLIVAGPKRMIAWAFVLGKYMAQLRRMWSQAMDVLQKEFDDAGMDIKLPRDIPTRNDVNKFAADVMKPMTDPLEEASREVKEVTRTAQKEVEDLKKTKILEDVKAQPRQMKVNIPTPTKKTEPKPEEVPAEPEATPPDEPNAEEESFGTWSNTTEMNGKSDAPD
jgi:Sec-independent protein translocase protein TatA